MTFARAIAGRYFPGPGRRYGGVTSVPAANILYALPIDLVMRIDALALWNVGGGSPEPGYAAPQVRMGLYGANLNNGLPDYLIEASDAFDIDNGHNGIVEFALDGPFQLTGSEWMAAVFTGDPCPSLVANAIDCDKHQLQHRFGTSNPASAIQPSLNGVQASFTFGPLPGTFPTPSLTNTDLGLAVRAG